MLKVREYGNPGNPPVFVLHGGPGAAGHMAPVARGLADAYRVFEPYQRRAGGEPLTVARHIADLHEVCERYAAGCRPALLGASWGAMLALAYAAAHPDAAVPLILVGCGSFDPAARAEFRRILAERTTDEIRAQFEQAERLGGGEGLRAMAKALTPIYSYDPLDLPEEEAGIDAKGHRETWDDMMRLQAEGVYPAAFPAIEAPVLMVHGAFDPHPGRLIAASLLPYIAQLEYLELEQCGHDPWAERAAAAPFFSCVHKWLALHIVQPGPAFAGLNSSGNLCTNNALACGKMGPRFRGDDGCGGIAPAFHTGGSIGAGDPIPAYRSGASSL